MFQLGVISEYLLLLAVAYGSPTKKALYRETLLRVHQTLSIVQVRDRIFQRGTLCRQKNIRLD